MKDCIKFKVEVANDQNGRLAKIAESVAGTDHVKLDVLAGYLSLPNFVERVRNYIKSRQADGIYLNEDINKPLIEINGNIIKKVLNNLYNSEHADIANTIVENYGNKSLFTNAKARSLAIDHVANRVLKTYYDNVHARSEERKTKEQIIKEIRQQLKNDFLDEVVTPLINIIETSDEYSATAKKMVDNIKNIEQKLDETREEYANLKEQSKTVVNGSKAKLELNNQIKSVVEANKNLAQQRLNAMYALIAEAGNDRQKNHSALMQTMEGNPNKWFASVFQSTKLTNMARTFEEVLESDKLRDYTAADENDLVNANSENIDEMSKSWEDKLYASFDKSVAVDLKLYFNTLYKLNAPAELDSDKYDFDTNNELGVKTTMGVNFVISQILNYGNFSSVNAFVKSLERASRFNHSLYGLSKMVNDMRANMEFANYVFTQLGDVKTRKTICLIEESGINLTQSNRTIDPLGFNIVQMFNSIKTNFKEQFNINDHSDFEILKNSFKNRSTKGVNAKLDEAIESIKDYLLKYVPSFDENALNEYINQNKDNKQKVVTELLTRLGQLDNAVRELVNDYNNELLRYNKAWAEYKQAREAGELDLQEPYFNNDVLDFNSLYQHVIDIAKRISPYSVTKNELNSVNAEGNTASDLLKNNYIFNLVKQIQFGSNENANAGLERLKDFVTKGKQYEHSPIFFGVQDANGREVIPGLFRRNKATGEVTINPEAKNIIDVSLFDGAKDKVGSKAAMYQQMSKGDYFLTSLYAFNSPIKSGDTVALADEDNKRIYAGFFMRTPSDAPKNFIIRGRKYSMIGDNAMFTPDVKSKNDFIQKVQNRFANKFHYEQSDEKIAVLAVDKKNKLTAEQVYELFTDKQTTINYENYRKVLEDRNTGEVSIDFYYNPTNENSVIITVTGKRLEGDNSKIMVDAKVSNIVVDENHTTMPDGFYSDVMDNIINDGIRLGQITKTVNTRNTAFRALRTHLLNEINTFFDQLNNVLVKNKDGFWVTKDNADGLIDRAHYNSSIVKEVTLPNGKKQLQLTGNFFTFQKLFESNGYNVDKAIKTALHLYGGENEILIEKDGHLQLNTNATNNIIKIDEQAARPITFINNSLDNLIDNIVTTWSQNFDIEIANRTAQYETIIDDRFTADEISEIMFNNAIMEMNFDDLFEGDSKFYKSAQDFLKRAKEVQAGGKVYAGFDLNDQIGGELQNIKDFNGAEQEINIGSKDNPRYINLPRRGNMKARNGFRAVTITNSVNSIENAPQIRQELYDINIRKGMTPERANKIANEIANGYFENTKRNDAQSYITFEEFVARRYADGTLNEYLDIINQIMDVREGKKSIEDLDLKNINSRIQVQKNFYFDKQFDTYTQTFYPRQIKNAEFVLIPELLEGTDLHTLWEIMNKYDIGQVNTVETSKAAKKNICQFWDNDNIAHPEEFEVQLQYNNEAAIENYYYRYLYKQQDVPEHMKDAANKAGIQIMKKIIDNADESVKEHIDAFFDNYVANIRDDFNRLLANMGWAEKNGRIINEDGSDLGWDEFYKKARQEAQRLGLDSNLLEYLTPTEPGGNPIMPNFMNLNSSKLESIAQSIWNSGVTRQTLPGWHGAQVTGIGHGVKVKDSNGQFRSLRYHPANENGTGNEAYAEIMIPRWSNLIPKGKTAEETEAILEQIKNEGLDIQIGYRIPTEGKQSVSVLKVVGFLDDVYGSTVMVPDAWVTQTGSDFDVDSVYAITYHMYKGVDGQIHKVKFDTDTSDEAVANRYRNYIKEAIKRRKESNLEEDIFDDKVKELTSTLKRRHLEKANAELNEDDKEGKNSLFDKLVKESAIPWKKLVNKNDEFKKKAIEINNKYRRGSNSIRRYRELVKLAQENIDVFAAEDRDLVLEFIDTNNNLADILEFKSRKYEQMTPTYQSSKAQTFIDNYNNAIEDFTNSISEHAKELNLPSLEEFAEWSIEEQNSREARDNKILDSMINIMSSENSREENYSRSNFDDLTDAMKHCDGLRGAAKVNRSAYNPLDQIDFMENAMSGAQLKAFSVTRDTFNSVNNYTKSELSNSHWITVDYYADQYDINNAVEAYGLSDGTKPGVIPFAANGEMIVDSNRLNEAVSFRVIHAKFGNSLNNRNIVGKLLTPYSSQTTAHILDAIKEGAIFNENDFTFGTFKTLVDVGIDYNTAIAFLMQPGITEIVNTNNETKSIFVRGGGNVINNAIKRLAAKYNFIVDGKPINDYTSMPLLVKALMSNQEFAQAFKELFPATQAPVDSFMGISLPLNRKLLEQRLSEQNVGSYNMSNLVFDIAMIANFNKYYNTTKNIEALARCSNPDRFGAKQTIRETRDKVADIKKYYGNVMPESIGMTLKVGDKNLMQALYPGIDNNNINIKESKYKYLAAFLKYSTLPSIDTNKQLFDTEKDSFNVVLDHVQSKLGIKFTNEQYAEYKQYMIQDVYATSPSLSTPLTIDENGFIIEDTDRINEINEANDRYWDLERSRIFGYETTESSDIDINDLNNPNIYEKKQFNKLSPAQKVVFIQQHFKDNPGLFGLLQVNTFNQNEYKNKGYSSQTIKFADQIENIEEMYQAFNDVFFNKNWFVKSAALDLIKYAFIVEGFKFKKGGISKIISNIALYQDRSKGGLDIISEIRQNFNTRSNIASKSSQQFIDKFIRSHPEFTKEIVVKFRKKGFNTMQAEYNTFVVSDDRTVKYISPTRENSELRNQLLTTDGIRNYVRITVRNNKNTTTTLYKVINDNGHIYLYPLNTLDKSETTEFSANKANNRYATSDYYEEVINQHRQQINHDIAVKQKEAGETYSKNDANYENPGSEYYTLLREKFTIPRRQIKFVYNTTVNPNELNRIADNGSKIQKASMEHFFSKVTDYFNSPVEERGRYGLVFSNDANVNRLFPNNAVKIIQNIPVNGIMKQIAITRYKPSKLFKRGSSLQEIIDITKLSVEERRVFNDAKQIMSVNPPIFKIEEVINADQVKNENTEADESRRAAITSIIEDYENNVADNSLEFTESEQTAKDIITELTRQSWGFDDESKDLNAVYAVKQFALNKIDNFSARSIKNNKANIFSIASRYYQSKASELYKNLTEFACQDGEARAINTPEFYEYLRQHPEDYATVVKLILDAKTFGNSLYSIMSLNVQGEDAKTSQSIIEIRNAINSVKNSDVIKKAVELFFDDYIANEYSTNPMIRNGLSSLRTQFGDTNWFDLQFSDIGELNHKQIQTIAKYTYAILHEATKITAPAMVEEFTKQYNEIMNKGNVDFDRFIDGNGKFINSYTDKYLEDRAALTKEVNGLYDKYIEDLNNNGDYTTSGLNYFKAKLRKDEWLTKNTERPVQNSYYEALNAQTAVVLKDAGDLFVKYNAIQHQLYNNFDASLPLSDEDKKKRKELYKRLSQLTSEVAPDGVTLKSDKSRFKISVLRNYLAKKAALNQQYFRYDERPGFRKLLEKHTKFLERYNAKHVTDTLAEKLENEDYRTAYDWIQANTNYRMNKEGQKLIDEAFKVLKDKDNVRNSTIKAILNKAEAYDEHGVIDARKLSVDDIKRIKELTSNKYQLFYDAQAGESTLIKMTTKKSPVLTNLFWQSLRAPGEAELNPARLTTIANINNLLGKAVDIKTNNFSIQTLFEKLTTDELYKLAAYYRQLREIKGNRNNAEIAKKFKNKVEFKTDDVEFNKAMAWVLSKFGNHSQEYDLALSIIVATKPDGELITSKKTGKFIPNSELFGYIVPKDKSFIDVKKTDARNFIENELSFEPTVYYYQAMEEATNNGTFDEWFRDNHVYNQYTHKYEPLKVWTTMDVIPGGKLDTMGAFAMNPTYDNLERSVKDGRNGEEDYRNEKYIEDGENYNESTGQYNNYNRLTSGDIDMMNLMKGWLRKFANTYGTRQFVNKGFLPRRAVHKTDAKYWAKQAVGTFGLAFTNTGESRWTDKLDYAHDFDADFDMLSHIKAKGYKEIPAKPRRGVLELESEYNNRLEDWKKEVQSISDNNAKLESAILDRDWKSVFQDFITKGVDYQARQRVKNTLYLTLEDIKDNPAIKTSRFSGNPVIDNSRSTDANNVYDTVEQRNTYEIFQNWCRRVLFNQFKKNTPMSKYADMLQNMTSAKYMIFNVHGGIANVGTGKANIFNEVFAKEYFNYKDFVAARNQYMGSIHYILSDLYSETSKDRTTAIIKLFDIVDFDSIRERRPNETSVENVKRVRDALYGFQSMGEHYMQNTVLLAMLKSNKRFEDVDGTVRWGTFTEYTWSLEHATMKKIIDDIDRRNGDQSLSLLYNSYIYDIKKNLKELKKYDTFTADINEDFMRAHLTTTQIREYIKARKEAIASAKEEWNDETKHPTIDSQLEHTETGRIVIKNDSDFTGKDFGLFRQKVIQVNKKIHGVYDKIGAAKLESEWFGGLVMQYHKHIYPGIMKRFRTKGYYNELRDTIEYGSYISLVKFLAEPYIRNIKAGKTDDVTQTILNSIKNILTTTVNIENWKLNWQMMPEWERNNIMRIYGDAAGCTAALLIAMAIYGITDDEELKENEFWASGLYVADRLLMEAQMYTPWGLITEGKTLWSSPIAAQNGPMDIIKALGLAAQWMYDDDFDINYKTGLYKGENKLAVLAYRNTPAYRIYRRLQRMTKNNSYYKLDESALNMKLSKDIADFILPDEE